MKGRPWCVDEVQAILMRGAEFVCVGTIVTMKVILWWSSLSVRDMCLSISVRGHVSRGQSSVSGVGQGHIYV